MSDQNRVTDSSPTFYLCAIDASMWNARDDGGGGVHHSLIHVPNCRLKNRLAA